MDLSTMSLEELRELQGRVSKAIAAGADQELAAARAQIAEIAKRTGINLRDLVAAKPKAMKKAKSSARYKHPTNNALVWSGRGRPPRWVTELRAAGEQPVEIS